MQPNLQWITIDNFSAGIAQRLSPNYPLGQATEENTYRCIATDSGSLVPLPKKTQSITHPAFEGGSILSEEYRVCGIFANNPVYSSDTVPGPNQNNTEILVAFEYYFQNGPTQELRRRLDRYSRHRATPAWENIYSNNESSTYNPNVRPTHCEMRSGRSNSSSPSNAGPIVVAVAWAGKAFMFPDDTNTLVTSTANLPTAPLVPPDLIETHQNRAVIFPLATLGDGTNVVYPTNEQFYWTAPNNFTALDPALNGNYANVSIVAETPTGYKVAESLSANELLLIKTKGGALKLVNALNDFNVQSLPHVMSTGNSFNRGVKTPLGFMYPVEGDGIWLWEGGDTSRPVTLQMLPDFWRPNPVAPAYGSPPVATGWGYGHTSSAQWRRYTLFPNNWVYDVDRNSWWRIDPVTQAYDTIHWWATDWTGRWAYGCTSGFSTGSQPVLFEWDSKVPVNNYSWQSHPFSPTLERKIDVREVVAVVEGPANSTIDVTISSGEGNTQTETFTIPSANKVHIIRHNYAVQGSYIQARIVANDSNTAPTVHALRVGYMERMRKEVAG